MKLMNKSKGFTLIELVIVIVILGILAVTAAPKFLNLQDDARVATIKGLAGAMKSAGSIVYGKSAIQGEENKATGSVEIVGVGTVATAYGYPADGTNMELVVDGIDDTGTADFVSGPVDDTGSTITAPGPDTDLSSTGYVFGYDSFNCSVAYYPASLDDTSSTDILPAEVQVFGSVEGCEAN